MASWPLRVADRRIYMTLHALQRYGERVRPHLASYERMHADCARLVQVAGELSDVPPAWINGHWEREMDAEPRGWLVCGDICMPLAEDREKPGRLVALSTLTRGGISDIARADRNRRRSARTHAKRRRARLEHNLMRGQRPEAEFDA